MRYYLVLKSNEGMLTFLTPQDSFDVALKAGEFLKANHNTVWLRTDGRMDDCRWRESITTRNIIDCMLEWGTIKRVPRPL